jgi:outer membrane receptor for ferric coprogen and ferric-rhodotorulic acid
VSNYKWSSVYRDTGEVYIDPYRENGVVTPYGGVIYAFDKRWSGYASVSDIFQPQNQRTADGALLDPLKGRNLEVGLKGELFDGKVNTSLALFRIEQRNRAELDLVNTCTSGTECYFSAGKVRSEGLDAEISGEVAPGWQLFAGYTLNNFKYLEQTSNAGVMFASTYSPRHMLRAWSDYRLSGALQKWSVGGGVNFQTDAEHHGGARRVCLVERARRLPDRPQLDGGDVRDELARQALLPDGGRAGLGQFLWRTAQGATDFARALLNQTPMPEDAMAPSAAG